jgi:hypothetical protein
VPLDELVLQVNSGWAVTGQLVNSNAGNGMRNNMCFTPNLLLSWLDKNQAPMQELRSTASTLLPHPQRTDHPVRPGPCSLLAVYTVNDLLAVLPCAAATAALPATICYITDPPVRPGPCSLLPGLPHPAATPKGSRGSTCRLAGSGGTHAASCKR